MAHKWASHTPQQDQGTGRIYFEQNEPKFGPKHPGVGVRHALTRPAQSVHAAHLRLSLMKINEQWGRKVIYSL